MRTQSVTTRKQMNTYNKQKYSYLQIYSRHFENEQNAHSYMYMMYVNIDLILSIIFHNLKQI